VRTLVHRFASMKIAVTLLVALLVVLGAGTIVESAKGAETAGRLVYYAWWFHALEAAFAINVLASIVDHWPWGARRTGFLFTHSSLIVILTGAAVTQLFKIEGHMPIWEGEKAAQFTREGTHAGEIVTLPFALHLTAFEIDTYPGTKRPAMFRSRVVVDDAGTGKLLPAVIQMNQELSYGGWKFFQSSYHQTQDRDQTVLSVAKDPGQPIVFLGYLLLLIGMVTVLGTRIVQARAIANGLPQSKIRPLGKVAALAIGLAVAGSHAFAGPVPDAATVASLKRLPVQHDGRVMPLDTMAREAAWNVTGQTRWQGVDAATMVVGWMISPDAWAREPLVAIGSNALAKEIGLPPGADRATFEELARNQRLVALIQQARAAEREDRKLTGTLAAASKLEGRLDWMWGFLTGSSLTVVPHPTEAKGTWSVPPAVSLEALQQLTSDRSPAPSYPTSAAIEREIFYNAVRPTRVAWIVLLAGTVLAIFAMRTERRWLDWASLSALGAGFAVMTWGIATRWSLAERIPASNMYESLLFLAWGVLFFALIAYAVLRNRLVVLNAAAMSALTMALTDLLPIDGFIHPVMPVLANTAWLAIHVPIIMVSYSVLALGVLFAHMQIGIGLFSPKRQELVSRMNELLYWYIHIGTILLVAGILTGSVWASSSWGRYWGWDPKEVWSLVAFLAYLAVLHARFQRYLGPFGVAAVSIAAFWMILMTYLGVNFVLTAGLHSYGFGGSSMLNAMLGVAGLEIAFVGAGWLAYRRNQRTGGGFGASRRLPAV
jgi:cytochrome c-type biogenesis protein CcsB